MIGSSAGTREHTSSPEEFVVWKGAKVLWPVDMPDYIIDYVVLKWCAIQYCSNRNTAEVRELYILLVQTPEKPMVWNMKLETVVHTFALESKAAEAPARPAVVSASTTLCPLFCSKGLMDEESADQPSTQLAEALKKDLDNKWGPYWHVTMGNNFGSYVVHQKRRFVYFTIGHTAFLIYKAQ